jgi:hypothetical protein
MYMRKYLSFFFFMFCLFTATDIAAQKGKLIFRLATDSYDADKKIKVVLSDSSNTVIGNKVRLVVDSLYDAAFEFDSLNPGEYNLLVFVDYIPKYHHYNIKIQGGKVTDIYGYWETTRYEYNGKDSTADFSISPFVSYGGPVVGDEIKTSLNGVISVGINYNPTTMLNKHISFGGHYGPALSYGYFNKDTIPGKKYERYVGADMNVGLFFRYNSEGGYKKPRTGFVFDIGGYYAIPVVFRHAYNVNNTVVQDRWIHQYTNLEAFVRIGIHPIVIQTEYRLFDYILGNYPELPRFKLGIALLINSE